MIHIPTKTNEQTGGVQDTASVALVTLAKHVALLTAGPTMTRGGSLISGQMAFVASGLTAGDGPFLCGIANKSLDISELNEYLTIQGPVEPTAVPQVERSTRGKLLRKLGMAAPVGDGSVAVLYVDNRSLSGLRFNEESAGWNYFVMNLGRDLTTGATMNVQADLFLRWTKSG